MAISTIRNFVISIAHAWFLALTACCLFSCQNNQKSQLNKNSAEDSSATKKATLVYEFKQVIQGVWIKKDYIDKIALTKSPAAAAELANGITVIYFDKAKIAGDSLLADAVWNNHEGGNITLHFKPGKRPHTLLLFEDTGGYVVSSLGYKVIGQDTLLIKYHTERGKTTAVSYLKALNNQPHNKLDEGINYLINKYVVAGNYILTDHEGKRTHVSFNNNGQIKGFDQFYTYYLKNDVGGEPMNNLDEIMFNISTKAKRKDFAYKVTGDTLTLFESYANDDFTESIIGKPLYKLIKQHDSKYR
jgi:hypothetical protein